MQSNSNTKLCIPGLDGIRALAVTAVILFHAGINNLMPGGYLGVDVFFTLSGFLITSLILNEVTTTGSFRIAEFLQRRFKRLYPALLVVVVISCIYSIFFANDSLSAIKYDLLPSIFYYSNIHQLINDVPYFEQFERPHPFQHLWSLAVEMHFYLIWPIIFIFYSSQHHSYYKYFALFLAILLTLWGIYLVDGLNIPFDTKPEKFYFRTDTRVVDIIIGAFLAFCFKPTNQKNYNWFTNLVAKGGWASLVLLTLAFLLIDESSFWLYRGGFSVISLATCSLIVSASNEGGLLHRLFNTNILIWLGERSYSLYLWHWPVFTFLRAGVELPSNPYISFVIRIFLTITLADLTFRLIESRFKGNLSVAYGALSRIVYVSFAVTSIAIFVYIFNLDKTTNTTENSSLNTNQNDVVMAATTDINNLTISQDELRGKIKSYPLELTDIRITALGDSVMLGTRPSLVRHLPISKLDAVVGRQGSDALKLIKELKASGQISNEVLLHIGTNGYVYEQHLQSMLELLADRKKVVVFNIHADRRWTQPNNLLFKKYSILYPGYVFVDWEQASANHPEFFVKDGIHLSAQGMLMFTKLAKDAFGVPDVPKDYLHIQSQTTLSPRKNKPQDILNTPRLVEKESREPQVTDDNGAESRSQP